MPIVIRSSAHLFPANHPVMCDHGHTCDQAVVYHDGAWWITSGHCAFNSPRNNARGYRSEFDARRAILKAERPAFRERIAALGRV